MSRLPGPVAAEPESAMADQLQQFLTFTLNDEVYAIGILHSREIIEYDNLTLVPLMPDFIAGVINLRGNVVPVVNLARRFGQPPREIGKRTSIIIVNIDAGETDSLEVGVVVDRVNEVIELAEPDIIDPPRFGARIRADFIEGMGRLDDRLIILLDVGGVLSVEELSSVIDIAEVHDHHRTGNA